MQTSDFSKEPQKKVSYLTKPTNELHVRLKTLTNNILKRETKTDTSFHSKKKIDLNEKRQILTYPELESSFYKTKTSCKYITNVYQKNHEDMKRSKSRKTEVIDFDPQKILKKLNHSRIGNFISGTRKSGRNETRLLFKSEAPKVNDSFQS